MLGHLAHFGKLLVGLCLTQSGGTVAVIAFPVESLLTDRAHQLCPVVALVTRDVLALIAQVDVLVESVAEDDDLIKVLEAFLILSFKVTAISGVAFLEDGAACQRTCGKSGSWESEACRHP